MWSLYRPTVILKQFIELERTYFFVTLYDIYQYLVIT